MKEGKDGRLHSPVCPCKAHQLTLGKRSRYKEKGKRGKKPLGSAWALGVLSGMRSW